MGNICRSPMAEAMFRHQAVNRGVMERFTIDSAGTGGWHEGSPPDERMQETARRNGVAMDCSARQVRPSDFTDFDLILCMDRENHGNLLRAGAPPERVRLMLDFHHDDDHREVPDPYYGEHDGFQLVFELLESSTSNLLDSLLSEES
ncbi:MAG: protein tyrosine phosphatase [Phycisphaerae bacterium]|nr:protein tyrosine phosphatase [Phycisphaerae bacterium]|tara:strand:+ start:912 stop:1352 length:441 start_codon:yes stop_codon:yes gene_type:complete